MLNATPSREMGCEDLKDLLAKMAGAFEASAKFLEADGSPTVAERLRDRALECRVAAGYAKATHHYDDRDQT